MEAETKEGSGNDGKEGLAASVDIGFIDRFSGTLIITGTIADVKMAFEKILDYADNEMGFTVCKITMA